MIDFKFLIGEEVVQAEATLPPDQQAPWPIDTIVLYGFEDGRIVCRIAAMNLTVLEGTWVAEDKRSTPVAYRAMKMMEEFLVEYCNKTHAMALVYDGQPQIAEYLKRIGFDKVPVTFLQKALVKKSEAA